MKKTLTLLLTCILATTLSAQKVWSFQDCVDYALKNNLNINQSKLNTDYASNTVLQNKMDLYTPNVNFTVTEGFNFANSVDPLTFEFIQQSTNSTVIGLNLDYTIFQGLSRLKTIKASSLELNATQLEQEELENNTKLLVANYYLNAMLAKEALQIVKETQLLTKNQYKNTVELVNAGVLAEGDKYEVEAQMATDALNVVNAENTLITALNQLKFLLQVNANEDFEIEAIDQQAIILEELGALDYATTTENAINKLPNIQSAELRLKAAEYQLKAAKGSLSPSVSFSAYLGSNYFSAARAQVGETTVTAPIGLVSGTNQLVVSSFNQPIFGDKSFGQQVGDNFNQNIRFNLLVPIFGKWQRMIAIDNAKLNIQKIAYDVDLKKNTLQQDIFNAQTSLKGAVKQYEASEKNNEAAGKAFGYAEEKYKAGVINTFEFETAKNRVVTAQTSLAQAKFEYLFRKMISEFYETGDLSF